MRTLKKNGKLCLFFNIGATLFIFVWTVYLNRMNRVSGLYMDDLYTWVCYDSQGFLEFLFPVGSTRFRPVYWLVSWIELFVIGNRFWLIVPINVLVLFVTALVCYFIMTKLSGSRMLSLFGTIALVTSRFSYYDISQLLGLLESIPMFFTVILCYELYRFMEDGDNRRFYASLILYLLDCFTHERYMVLLPMFLYVLICTRNRDRKKYLLSVLSLLFVLLVRYLFIGKILPAGTGGTEIAETFTVKSFISSVKDEVLYIFGFNPGPEYLSGITWTDVNPAVKKLVHFGAVLMFLMFVFFILSAATAGKKDGKVGLLAARDFMYFCGYIIGLVTASSVTIRVEMRWIYTSFVMFLFLFSYMHGYIQSTLKIRKAFVTAAVAVIFFILMSEDIYYRQFWHNIYLFPNQNRYNSLSDVTWGKYQEEMFEKRIFIIGNSYEMAEYTARQFFESFDIDNVAEGIHAEHVDSEAEIPKDAWEHDIILKEDPPNNAFVQIN